MNDIEQTVQEVFAELTRYPLDILTPEADFEEELGIDSVKLAEIFTVLQARFELPDIESLPLEQMSSIAAVAQGISDWKSGAYQTAGSPALPSTAHTYAEPTRTDSIAAIVPSANSVADGNSRNGSFGRFSRQYDAAEIEQAVQEVFAELTRYPLDILTPDADLEEELGIDSVKLAEIFAVLQARFELPDVEELPLEGFNSISAIAGGIFTWVHQPREQNAVTSPSSSTPTATNPSAMQGDDGQDNQRGRTRATPVDGLAWSEEVIPIPNVDPVRTVNDLPSHQDSLRPRSNDAARKSDRSQLPWLANADSDSPYVSNAETNGPIRSAPWTKSSPSSSATPRSPPFYSPNHKPFAGRVALVTGAGHGIGKQIALQLATMGATVAVNSFHSRNEGVETAEQILSEGGDAMHVWGSVANSDQHEAIFQQIETRYGGLDLFVSNASNGIIAPLEFVSEAHWDRAFHTNVVGLHRGAMFASKLMRRRGGGKILTISSPGAQCYIEHFGCMGPVKAAVESLVRYLSIELGPYNIQVNAISAGPIYGELLGKYPEGERLVPYWESITLGNRLGNEQDLAEAVMFLLSPISDKITGSVLLVDGGGSQRI